MAAAPLTLIFQRQLGKTSNLELSGTVLHLMLPRKGSPQSNFASFSCVVPSALKGGDKRHLIFQCNRRTVWK